MSSRQVVGGFRVEQLEGSGRLVLVYIISG